MASLSAIRRAILFAAMGNLASSFSERDMLPDDSETPVSINIDARVKKAKLSPSFTGTLFVGKPFEKSSSVSANTTHLLAVMVSKLPEYERAKLFRQCTSMFGKKQELPAVSDDVMAECKAFLKGLRAKKTVTSRGVVKFDATEA